MILSQSTTLKNNGGGSADWPSLRPCSLAHAAEPLPFSFVSIIERTRTMSEQPLLSYCMIVKNEAEGLEENLANARPFVDEIIIVDTGSTDGTVGIAKEYADEVIEIEWPDSFSAARNVGLERASGEYIMYLDGDEAITNPDHWRNIYKKLTTESPTAVAIQIENSLPDNQILEGDKVWEVRIFPNHPDVRFRGRVHNQITPAIKEVFGDGDKLEAEKVKAVSHHVGYDYSPEELQEKYEKRVPLLKKEVEEAEDEKWRSYYQYQLGNGYFMLGEKEKALEALESANYGVLTEENRYSVYLMACHSALAVDNVGKADMYAHDMMELWPQEALGMMMRGICQLEEERYNAAFTLILAAMQVGNARDDLRYQIDEHFAAAAAGEAALKMGKYGRAKKLFNYHLDRYPGNEDVREIEQQLIPASEVEEETPNQTPSHSD